METKENLHNLTWLPLEILISNNTPEEIVNVTTPQGGLIKIIIREGDINLTFERAMNDLKFLEQDAINFLINRWKESLR